MPKSSEKFAIGYHCSRDDGATSANMLLLAYCGFGAVKNLKCLLLLFFTPGPRSRQETQRRYMERMGLVEH